MEEEYGAHNYHPLDVVITRGEGVWVYDVEGNRYLDCLSAYSALNQGHVHPKILAALMEQAQTDPDLARFPQRPAAFVLQGALRADRLRDVAADELGRGSGRDGDEAGAQMGLPGQESATASSRDHYVRQGNFHGRTISIISFSTEPLYQDDFGPFTPGFITVPYGDAEQSKKPSPPTPPPCWWSPSRAKAA